MPEEQHIRKLDPSGRVNIPKEYRERFETDMYEVKLSSNGNEIILIPVEVEIRRKTTDRQTED